MRKREPVLSSTPTAAAAAPAPLTTPRDEPEWTGPYVLGRMVVVLVTVLLVSRPLVRGEDPGLISDFADPGGLVWTFLAVLGLVVWSLWRPWSGEEALYVGPVEVALLLLGLWQFVAAANAPIRNPAWLAAWQWFGLALAVFLLRQVARTPGDRRGLMAALLATGVAIAAEGLYQAVFPARLDENTLRREALSPAMSLAPWEWKPAPWEWRPAPWEWEEVNRPRRVNGPFFYSASLAAVLILLLPGLTAAWLACRRAGGAKWHQAALLTATLLAAAMLVMTGAWLMILLAFSVGLLFVGVALPRDVRGKIGAGLTCLCGAAIAMWVLAGAGLLDGPVGRAKDTWPAAWELFNQHPWLGLGPEQFVYFYPGVMAETAGVKVRQPSSALLQTATAMGVLGVVGLVAIFVLFTRAVVRWWQQPAPIETDDGPPAEAVRWEFYLGGMVALVLVFVLRASSLPPEEILNEALAAAVRAMAWFAGVALVDRVKWPPRLLVGALTAGVAGMAASLLVSPGFEAPSVAGPLFLAMGLAVAVVAPEPVGWLSRLRPVTALLPPVLIALAFGFFAFVFYPAANSIAATAKVRHILLRLLREGPRGGLAIAPPSPDFMRSDIIEPLEKALKEDPENVRTRVLLHDCYGWLWGISPRDNPEAVVRAFRAAGKAREVAPAAPDGYRAEVNLRWRVAALRLARARQIEERLRDGKIKPDERKEVQRMLGLEYGDARRQRELAVALLRAYLEYDPADAAIRFYLAEALFDMGDRAPGREQAEEARRLDAVAPEPRSLSDRQRTQLRLWLAP